MMSSIYQIAGKNVRKYRKEQKLTQENLAEIAGISINFLGQIERGTKKASLETIDKLSNALKISIAKFFENNEKTYSVTENSNFNSYQTTSRLSSILKKKSFSEDLRKLILKHSKSI